MVKFDHSDPDTLLAAYVELAAEVLGRDVSEIGIDVPVGDLFERSRQWRQFSSRHLELAGLSSEEAAKLLGTSRPNDNDRAWWTEMRSLATLAAFFQPAKILLEKRQTLFEAPTLNSLSATYATRVFHSSGNAEVFFEPKTRKAVLVAGFIVTLAILLVSAISAWWNCPISEFGYQAFLGQVCFMFLFLGLSAVCCFGIFLAWGFRALRKEHKHDR